MKKPPSCIGCPYYDRPAIEGDGYVGAELVIIGQSPGPQEKAEGKPFVGASGQVLNRAMREAGISRNQNYITNAVKCFVPAGEKVLPEAVCKCAPLLEAELAQLPRAKTLLAVGAEAFNAITPKSIKFVHNRKAAEKDPSFWMRGVPYQLGERVVIGTLHPSFVMRSGFLNAPTFEHDIKRAAAFAEGKLKITTPTLYNHPTNKQAEDYIHEIIARGEGGIDIETPELDVDEDEADAILSIPITEIGLSAKIGESILLRPDQFGLLDPLLGGDSGRVGSKTVLWAYGAGFDFMHLGKRWNLANVQIADAMIAFYVLWSDLMSYDIATAQSYYASVPYYKNWRKLKPELYDTLGNCYDTFTAMEIGHFCLEEMRTKPINMEPLFWSLMPLIKCIETWRVKGCRYDVEAGFTALATLDATLKAYEDWWQANMPCEWSSPKQLIALFESLGYKVPLRKRQKKDKTIVYTPSVDDEALATLARKGASVAPLIQTMRELKGASDKLAISSPDGWVRTRAKIHGQAGGRLQLVNENLQQIPETMAGVETRSVIIGDVPEEDLILQFDYSQIEFFIYGSEPYANDPQIQAIQESGDYVYGYFYENIYHRPFFQEGKPRKKLYRHPDVSPAELLVCKSYPLGFTYGRTNIPSEYKWLLGWYHSQFKNVTPFHNELVFKATSKGYLQTVFGRMRRFPNARGQRNEILAFPGQSTLPDILFRYAIVPLTESLARLFGPRSRPLFTVHDSVICNIQGARRSLQVARDAIEHVESTCSAPVPELNNRRFAGEAKIGPSWGEGYLTHKLESWFASQEVARG